MDWFGPARREVLLDETLLDAALSPSGKMQALDALAEIKRLTMQLGLRVKDFSFRIFNFHG